MQHDDFMAPSPHPNPPPPGGRGPIGTFAIGPLDKPFKSEPALHLNGAGLVQNLPQSPCLVKRIDRNLLRNLISSFPPECFSYLCGSSESELGSLGCFRPSNLFSKFPRNYSFIA
jgi:hypothetical protein